MNLYTLAESLSGKEAEELLAILMNNRRIEMRRNALPLMATEYITATGNAIVGGNMIKAIQMVRARTGCGLMEAKTSVEVAIGR